MRRFSQEARAASALNHPNIVTVHDAGEFEDGPFLVMELVEGESLRALLRRGPLPLGKVLDFGIQAATALTRAHEGGITHRDLKPENLLVRPDGYVKILDFGLAKLKEKEAPAEGASTATTIDAGLTSEGSILGTAAYMSPEQATGRPVDGRSDIFSLALLLLESWQGRHPFLRGNILDTMHAIAHDRLPALGYPAGSQEWGLARILEKALEKEPEERYQTMKDLGIDLRRLRQESEPGKLASSAVAAPAHATRRPLLYAVAGLVALALLAGAGWLLVQSRQLAAPARLEYTQLTNFTDSATSPALSPDDRMLTFIRGTETFAGPGQIYVKLLFMREQWPRFILPMVARPPRFARFAERRGENRGITPPAVSWSPDGKFLYLNLRAASQIYVVPLQPGRNLPPLPASGIRSLEDAAALPGKRAILESRAFVGANPSIYAFPRIATQRNIYRIPVP